MVDGDGGRASDALSVYAPIRQRGALWWRYARQVANDGHVVADGRISPVLMPAIEQTLIPLYAERTQDVVQGQANAGDVLGMSLAKIMVLRHWVPLVAQYELCGRQIFDLRDELADMLGQTDLGDCTLEGWNAPYEAFYVRFGKQEAMSLPFEEGEREYLDGAYVARTPHPDGLRLKIGFTTVKDDGRGVMLPGYFIDLWPEEQKLPVAEAVDASLRRKMAELEADDLESGTVFSKALNSHRRVEMEDSAHLLRAGAALLVNALFYLEGLGAATPEPEPGRDTPPERVARWHQLDGAKRRKERSAMTADGYAVVRLVGAEVATAAATMTGGSRRAHWRRGHWRMQRHGEGMNLRKRLWIKPVMVAAGHHDGQELPGHVYVGGTGAVQ